MAPSISVQRPLDTVKDLKAALPQAPKPRYNEEVLARYIPEYDNHITYPALEAFEHRDPGHDATGAQIEGATYAKITPLLGTEISGRQVSSFTEAEKNELALLAGQRGLLVFRDQDFAEIGPKAQLEFVNYFGRVHIHPTSPHIKDHPEFHLVSRGYQNHNSGASAIDGWEVAQTSNQAEDEAVDIGNTISSTSWHSDVSYELQPPGTTFLWILENPESGGDTVFASQVEAYNRLSPEFRKRLEGLKVVHSGIEQAQEALQRGGHVRRESVTHVHPLVRTHPVTKQKALYVQPQFSRSIVGYKKEESDLLLNFLYQHIKQGVDFQARVKWTPGTLVVWDNRVTAHSALVDFKKSDRRLIARLTPQAEKPF